MVQVLVSMQAHEPYGQPRYWDVWQAAADRGLPVAVRADAGAGVDFHVTPVGYPRHYVEYYAWQSINSSFHLASLVAAGAFERIPSLRFIFLDGGHDMLTQLAWTLDTTWPSCRAETPWVRRFPSEYLVEQVRFCASPQEVPLLGNEEVADWERITHASRLLMFGSRYPHWSTSSPDALLPELEPELRHSVLAGNALELYGERLSLPPAA